MRNASQSNGFPLRNGLLLTLAISQIVGCGSDPVPSQPPPVTQPPAPPPIASLSVVPDSIDIFVTDTLTLRAVASDAQGNVLSSRSVLWTSSNPIVATVASSGLITAVGAGRVIITASAESRIGTAVVAVGAPDTLSVPPDTPIGAAIPDSVFVPGPGTYRTDHPSAPGIPFSPSILTVSFQASATAGQVNSLVKQIRGQIVGGISSRSSIAGGMLILRLPTTSHALMEDALTTLRRNSIVRSAVQNRPASTQGLPSRPQTELAGWSWDTPPQGGNWAFEVARIPSLWQLNDLIRRSGRRTHPLVVDRKFYPSHEDLTFERIVSPDSMIIRPGIAPADYHGTLVASVAGATFSNMRGIDGVDPFVHLTAMHWPDDMTEGLRQLGDQLIADPAIRVINQSMGENWSLSNPLPNQAFREALADQIGQLFVDAMLRVAATGRSLPYIVTSAGNDNLDARQNGWFANAGVKHGFAPVIVVEAIDQAGPSRTLLPEGSSNNGGHVSAGGAAVALAAGGGSQYTVESGTSFAAPFVAGLVSYLLALDPSIPDPTATTNPIRDMLKDSGRPISGGVPLVDGFATVIQLDRRHGNSAFGKVLVDVDDGTADGNRRVLPNGAIDTATARVADGRVDMRDFRRFRDWYLQINNANAVLDGPAQHPKKDLNGDGIVEPAFGAENVYPRGDFNGDGIISETATSAYGHNGRQLTDLEVLQQFFSDPDYQTADLPMLLESGDISVDPSGCAIAGATHVRSDVRVPGVGSIRRQLHATTSTSAILTVPGLGTATPFDVVVTALDASASVLSEVITTGVNVLPGSDQALNPTCPAPLSIATTPVPEGVVGTPYLHQLTANGGGTGVVTWSVVSGALPSGLALSAASGTIIGTPTAPCLCSFTVQARRGSLAANLTITILVSSVDPVLGDLQGTFQAAGGHTLNALGSIRRNIQPGGPAYLLTANWNSLLTPLICGLDGTVNQLVIDQFGCRAIVAPSGHIVSLKAAGTVTRDQITLPLKTNATAGDPYGTLTLNRVP